MAALIVALWSQPIGWEEIPASDSPPVEKTIHPKVSSHTSQEVRRTPRLHLPTEKGLSIDADRFLRSFRRQAAEDLTPCLATQEKSQGGGDRSIGLSAVLDAQGHIKEIRLIDPNKKISDCAREAIFKMDFADLTVHLSPGTTVTVQWRLDW